MSDWLKEYKQAWQLVEVDNIEQRLTALWPKIKEDQKKDRLSTIWMSISFLAAIGVIIWVAVNSNLSSWTSLATLAGMIILMLFTGYLRARAIAISPDPGKSEREHIDLLIRSYSLRLMMQLRYIWVYITILNLLLITFFADSFLPQTIEKFVLVSLGSIGYCGLVLLLINKKRRRNIQFLRNVIKNLELIRKDLKESQE